jgi:hypothetical protein
MTMQGERIVLPADPADPEDFDVTAEAMDRGQEVRMLLKALGLCGDPLFGIEVVGDIKPAESFSGHEHSLRLTLDRSCDPHHVRGVLYRVAPWP